MNDIAHKDEIQDLKDEVYALEQEVKAQKLIAEQLKLAVLERDKQIQLYRLKIQSVALVLRD